MLTIANATRLQAGLLLAGSLLLAALPTHAQMPTWSGAVGVAAAEITAVATDATGNVFVTGYFQGTATFGGTVLTSAGSSDLFVAKYVPATSTWAWAQRGGGTDNDSGQGIAVLGTSVYVTGTIYTNTSNGDNVTFGGPSPATSVAAVPGASATSSQDIVLAKYTDHGTTATLSWTQVGGGQEDDGGYGVAVSGTSVYVTGYLYNNTTNAAGAVFGGSGSVAGTSQVNGAHLYQSADLLLAKYTDHGPTGSYVWSQVGGGEGRDVGRGVAVSGPNVYVTGLIRNTTLNLLHVVFGGGGTVAGTSQVNGAHFNQSADLLLAKYTDHGPTGSYVWSQVGGGYSQDWGLGVAVNGASVYVTGLINNNVSNSHGVVFGGGGTVAGTSQVNGATPTLSSDLLLAKYTDHGPTGSYVWSQVGGGTDEEYGSGVAVSGTSVYVTGFLSNDVSNSYGVVFGGGGTVVGTHPQAGTNLIAGYDLLLAKYTDHGPTGSYAWSQVGGGLEEDYGNGVAVSGRQVFVGGFAQHTATFGATTLTAPAGTSLAVLPYFTDSGVPMAGHSPTSSRPGLALFPNPAPGGVATLTGAPPRQAVQVVDVVGRAVLTVTTDEAGAARLARLPSGLYLVRAGAASTRLIVE